MRDDCHVADDHSAVADDVADSSLDIPFDQRSGRIAASPLPVSIAELEAPGFLDDLHYPFLIP